MQAKLALLVAMLGMASTACAEEDKPRIYFPRHVKRQFSNSTITSQDAFPPPETTPLDPTTSNTLSSSLEDLLPSLIDSLGLSSSSTAIPSSANSPLPTPTVASSSEVVESQAPPTTPEFSAAAVELSPTPESASSPASTTPLAPQSEPSLPPSSAAIEPSSISESLTLVPSTSEAPISSALVNPTEVVNSSTQPASEPATPSSTQAVSSSVIESATVSSSGIIVAPTGVVTPTSSAEPTPTPEQESSSAAATSSSIESPSIASSVSVTESIAPSGTSFALASESSQEAKSTNPLDPILSSASSNLPLPTSTPDEPIANATSTEVPVVSSSEIPISVPTILPSTTGPISDLPVPTEPVANATSSSETAEEPTTTLPAPTETLINITSSTEIPAPAPTNVLSSTEAIANSTATSVPVEQTTTGAPVTLTGSTSAPVPTTTAVGSVEPIPANSTSTEPPATVTSIGNTTEINTATSAPTVPASISSTVIANETSIATESPIPSSITLTTESSASATPEITATVPVNTTAIPTESTKPVETAPVISTTSASTTPVVTSVPATATITDSESWLPATIIVEQSSSLSTPTEALAPTSTVPLPSDLPKVISPPDPDLRQPKDSMLLQIGFLHGENYQHVSKNPNAAAQIFSFLPKALADAAGLDINQIQMTRLVPYDTSQTLGYITTLAMFYYPKSMVDTLRIDIKIPNSAIYNNPDQLVYNLTQNINPAIEIIPGMEDEPNPTNGDGSSSTNPSGNNNNDPLDQGNTNQTPIQKGTAAAIGIGAVGVAAAYGAAMFIIARRYKQKKQAHRRASSLSDSSEMRYTGTGSPAMMGGALMSRDFSSYGGIAGGRDSHGSGRTARSGMGNSTRTAYISAPVAAENSLGWN